MSLFLLTITQNRQNDIAEMLKDIYPVFDGVIAVDHYSNDGTYVELTNQQGKGKIIQRKFVMHHSHSMNELLFCRHMKNGDWALFLDSPERMTRLFLNSLHSLTKEFEANNIGSLYWDGRPYLFRYYDDQFFFGNPHWGLAGVRGEAYTLPDKDGYIVNKRWEKPEISFCLNPIKYWFCYNPSNEPDIMYGKYGSEILQNHINIRDVFRRRCEKELGMNLNSLDDLITFFKKGEFSDWFIETTELEFRLSELFQLKILNMDFMKEMHPRYKWSFKNYLKTGNGFSNPNYKGTVLIYDEQITTK